MGSLSILIIEDDHEMRVCFRQMLEEQGWKVHSVTNGRDGLDQLMFFNPDIIH